MNEQDWTEQGRRAREEIASLAFLIGEWEGHGQYYGTPVHGQLLVTSILDGTWIEAKESILKESDDSPMTDRTLYRFDSESDALQVLQLIEHAHMSTHTVELTPDGFRWITGPGSPQLYFRRQADGISYTIQSAEEDAPSVQMSYKRT